ncbi:MAG: hypothetical protein R2725_09550 [Solirubrobacterales bacterium]
MSPRTGCRGAGAALFVALGAALLAGCGGADFPRAAEPGDAPPLTEDPAGTVAPVGEMPEGLVFLPAAGVLAVGLRGPAGLGFVDPERLQLLATVPLPAPPRHLAVSADGSRAIVPAERADRLLTVSPDGVAGSTAVGAHPHDAVAAGERVFVADEFGDSVTVLRGGEVETTLTAPAQPGGIAAGGGYVALVAVAERVLQVYDARRPAKLGSVSGGVGPTHVVALGADAYVADTDGGVVRRYRLGPEPRQTAVAKASGAPYGIAVDPARRRLFVTLTARNRLAEYALGAGAPRLLATYPTVRQPNSVAVDPGSGAVFVAGREAGVLERIEPGEGGR